MANAFVQCVFNSITKGRLMLENRLLRSNEDLRGTIVGKWRQPYDEPGS